MSSSTYEPVIGLEIHAQMSTKSKMFCGCDNDSFNKQANSNTCPVCLGFPGTLPVLNKSAVEKGIKAALALQCQVNEFCKFDRKNYFYPDLPSGYQISQYDQPLAQKGELEIIVGDQKKIIGINRLHIENDAGKLTHIESGTLCDYNRAGTPLMEIVSEADLRSKEEASAYARQMQKILRAVGASDADMEKGMMRFDINVSVRKKGASQFGTKAEIKNLNSFRGLEKALEYEIERQIKDLEDGQQIIQETRGFDPAKEITFSQRSKEGAEDYRYFPEPDLPPIITEKKYVAEIKKTLPELPADKKNRYLTDFKLKSAEAELLSTDPDLSDFFESAVDLTKKPDKVIMWLTTRLLKFLNEENKSLKDSKITPENLSSLIQLIDQGDISDQIAKTKIFPEMYQTGQSPTDIIESQGLKQVTDIKLLEEISQKVLSQHPDTVRDYKAGQQKVLGFLIGQVIKETKGQGSPAAITDIVKKLLT